MNADNLTSIPISKGTRKKLGSLKEANGRESWDCLLNRLYTNEKNTAVPNELINALIQDKKFLNAMCEASERLKL